MPKVKANKYRFKRLRAVFSTIKDPRAGNARHKLFDVIFMALCATVAGAKTCFQIAEYVRAKEEFLCQLLALEHGVPSHDTFSRIFRILDPRAFEAAFRRFTSLFCRVLGKDSVVAFDGKAIRNAITKGSRFCPVQMVNVWACDAGIALAQFKAPNRNEVAGALEVLDLLSIAGTFVTADALHCRPDIAQAILDKGADYVLALKANHPKLLTAAKHCIDQAQAPSRDEHPVVRSHGRFERRRVSVVRAPGLADEHSFPGLRAVGRIETWRGKTKLPKKPTLKHFVLSRFVSAKRLRRLARSHWAIENHLHWRLDVTFGEDKARTYLGHGPENLAVLRKTALNMLQAHPARMPLQHKILRAGWRDDFLLEIFAHASKPRPA
jgi:predicted transposase YbfD/YdcC